MVEWQSVQQTIQSCRRCEVEAVAHLCVPSGEKREPPSEPLRPVRLYFVSVAPPWGGAYFWDETATDAVREGLFTSLGESLSQKIDGCSQFRDMQFFLTPAVKCPSTKNDRDHQPSRFAVRHCKNFLRDELLAAEPERILALGRVPFKSLCDIFGIVDAPQEVTRFRRRMWRVRLGTRLVPLSGTYFPGNNRHRGFACIAQDITRILMLSPKDCDVENLG